MTHQFYDNGGYVVAMSHAGDSSAAPASSLAAYQAAFDLGFRYFQIDVVQVAGNELVAGHAITGRQRSWEGSTHSELLDQHPQLARVQDLIDAIPGARWNLEIKSSFARHALFELLARQPNIHGRFAISAPFHGRILKAARQRFGNELCTSASLLEGSLVGQPLIPLSRQHADAVQIMYLLARSRKQIAKRTAEGIQYQPWPVNSEKEMDRLLDLGVTGIITDEHQLLKDVLQRKGLWA